MSERVAGYGYRYTVPRPVRRDFDLSKLTPVEHQRLMDVSDDIDTTAPRLAALRFERENLLQKARARHRVRRKVHA